MKENQNLPAEELDAYLSARQQGQQPAKPASLPAATTRLVDELVTLAVNSQPDPRFAAALEKDLQRTVKTQSKISPAQGLDAIRDFLGGRSHGQVERKPAMSNRTFFSLIGAAALVILLLVAIPAAIKFLSPAEQPVALVPSASTPIILPSSTPESVTPPVYLTPTAPFLPAEPPKLSLLSAWMTGGYGGGGQPTSLEHQFNLNTELPTGPSQATAYLQRAGAPTSIEYIWSIATQLGMSNARFYPWGAVDGSRQILFGSDQEIYYTDLSVLPDNGLWSYPPHALPPADLAASAAKTFLETHGLLGFPYRSKVGDDVVSFYRLLDGESQETSAFARVTVHADGRIGAVQYFPRIADAIGTYPLISAADAWQMLLSDEPAGRLWYRAYPLVSHNSRTWQRAYTTGERADVFSNLQVRPSDDGPYIATPNLILIGSEADLQALADAYASLLQQSGDTESPVHVWGTIQDAGGYRALQLEGWELSFEMDSLAGWQDASRSPYGWSGVIKREGTLGLFLSHAGLELKLPDLPDSLPDGISVFVQGGKVGDTLEWSRIQEKPGEWIPPASGSIVQANVEKVELVYLSQETTMINDETPDDLRILMPAWRFSGQTDQGMWFEAYVQAVSDEVLK